MDMDVAVWVGVAALVAACIGSLGGLPLTTVMTPVLMAVVPIESAIVLVAAVHLPESLLRLLRHRRGWDGAVFRTFGLGVLAAAGASAFLVGAVPSPVLMLILGLFLTGYAAFGLFERVRGWMLANQPALPVAGLCTGFFTGATGVGNALRDRMLKTRLEPAAALMMGALIAVLADVLRLSVYLMNDAGDLLTATAPVEVMGATLGAAVAGVLLGRGLRSRWADRDLNRLLRWPLLIVGIYFVEKSIRALFW